MKLLFVAIILMLVMINISCFIKSKKYFNKVAGDDEESNKNYEHGMKYIKISVIISFLICLVGATFVIVSKILV